MSILPSAAELRAAREEMDATVAAELQRKRALLQRLANQHLASIIQEKLGKYPGLEIYVGLEDLLARLPHEARSYAFTTAWALEFRSVFAGFLRSNPMLGYACRYPTRFVGREYDKQQDYNFTLPQLAIRPLKPGESQPQPEVEDEHPSINWGLLVSLIVGVLIFGYLFLK